MDNIFAREVEGTCNVDGEYNYSAPTNLEALDVEIRLIRALSETRSFHRLADIRFLGALDYCLVAHPNGARSNARFTRAQHSIGVAALARAYLSLRDISPEKRLICVAAAMLHDIGHSPFSHTLEPVFRDRFGIDHHQATKCIIVGDIFGGEIPQLLASFGVSTESVIATLDGEDDDFDGFFSGPINFDTIEGILRSRNYSRLQNLGLTPFRVLKAATLRSSENDLHIVDSFWGCKDDMYNLVIRSRLGVLFDSLFQEAARDRIDELEPNDFFSTETAMFKKFPILRQATQKHLWNEMAHALLPDKISFQTRRFHVDPTGNFFRREDAARYRQTKELSALTLDDSLPA